MGAILAVVVYFAKDIWRIVVGWSVGLFKPELRGTLDHRMGWYVIVGSIPIGIVGFALKDVITNELRSLWVVGIALIAWSPVMLFAERRGRQERAERDLTLTDALVVGLVQCIALVPGVSRSGATISAGLLRGLDRVAATRLSFFLSIPALLAAGVFELKDALGRAASVSVRRPSRRSSASWWPTPRWPGCSGSWPATRSAGSCPTASRSASSCSSLLGTGVMTAT